MAHLPPQFVAGLDPFSQPKTLFVPSPGTHGIVVMRRGEKFHQRVKKFTDAHAALDWCIANRAGMIFFHAADPSVN